MATKWADYCVSAVRYNSSKSHIDQLKVYIHDTDQHIMKEASTMSRAEAVKLIEQGKTFITITKSVDNKWTKGAALSIFPVMTDYLKTSPDKKTSDNLENLPTF